MNKVKLTLVIINFVALIGTIIWFFTSPAWESGITAIGLIGALVAQIFTNDEIKSKLKFIQKSNKHSHNYMAANNLTVTDNKKIQTGGNGAQLMQANIINVSHGIDEKRAREIYQEMNLQLRKDYTQEALNIASSRVAEFENKLMPKMQAVSGALEAFADPSFQLLLVEAQKAAASTERPADYDLLSELLIHRFQKGENRTTRAGINRAVEIVDQISDDALLGLTAFHAVSRFIPASGDIHQGLDVLNDLYSKILYRELPAGNEWLDHLDVLDTVRINSLGSMKKIKDYYPNILAGYVDVGIEKTSENYQKAIEILKGSGLPSNTLVDHIFNSNFVRLNITDKKQISSLKLQHLVPHNGNLVLAETPVTEEQIKALNSVYELYSKDGALKKQNLDQFMVEWDKRSKLKILREWWDNIKINIQITSVGKVLAHSNAQRCHSNLPPLD